MATGNPAFSNDIFAGYDQVYGAPRSATMTIQGTVAKTFALLAILFAAAIYTWNAGPEPIVIPVAGVGGLILALVTIFRPQFSPWTAPVYAAFEGVFLGGISLLIETSMARRGAPPGIAIQAVSLTCGTLCCMLLAYTTGLIKVTDKLRSGIVAATGAICLVYFVSIVLGMFGHTVPFLHAANPVGIGISLVIVGVAAFNLLLDFDMIDRGARSNAPKYMEWYGAFGLMVTLVWLYLEFLRLLQQIQSRQR